MESTSNLSANELPKKPIPLRVIFILNALMMILPFVFYFVVTSKGVDLGGLDPQLMIYTGIAYILSFAALVYFILNRNMTGFRIMFIINFLIALPAKAYLGMLVAVISIALTLFNGKVKAWFGV